MTRNIYLKDWNLTRLASSKNILNGHSGPEILIDVIMERPESFLSQKEAPIWKPSLAMLMHSNLAHVWWDTHQGWVEENFSSHRCQIRSNRELDQAQPEKLMKDS